jgi:uncharacterized CHY-type Zn-finger protein
MLIHGVTVIGLDVDSQTRCVHYHSPIDVIAIKFKCCGDWFPCFECHAATTEHKPLTWDQAEFNERAILCGVCGHQLTIAEYLNSGSVCPECSADFNPKCANHAHLYFSR